MGVHSATRPRAPGEPAAGRGDEDPPASPRGQRPRFAGASTGFAWLRFLGSLTVVIEHSGPILHPQQLTIFPGDWVHTPGYIALMGFFAMSGYQISESWHSDPLWWRFMAKRVLRIWPPMLAVVLLSALVIGPLVTVVSLSQYFSSSLTWGYVVNNATLYNIQHLLPGVFLNNPYPWSVNGSLWTLAMEFTGYLIVLICGLIGVFRGFRLLLFPILLGLLVANGFFGAEVGYGGNVGSLFNTPIGSMVEFLAAFVIGMIMFGYRQRLALNGYVAIGVFACYLAIVFTVPEFAKYALPFASGYAFIVLAHRWPPACARYDKYVYCSYGLYVWAFPLQQLVVLAGVDSSWLVALVSLPLVYLAGQFSWHVIELPTQSLRYYLYPRRRPERDAVDEDEYDEFDRDDYDAYEYDDDEFDDYEDVAEAEPPRPVPPPVAPRPPARRPQPVAAAEETAIIPKVAPRPRPFQRDSQPPHRPVPQANPAAQHGPPPRPGSRPLPEPPQQPRRPRHSPSPQPQQPAPERSQPQPSQPQRSPSQPRQPLPRRPRGGFPNGQTPNGQQPNGRPQQDASPAGRHAAPQPAQRDDQDQDRMVLRGELDWFAEPERGR